VRAGGIQGGGFDCGSNQLSAPWSPSFGTFLGEARKVHYCTDKKTAAPKRSSGDFILD